jgi:hypothetical protein
VRPEIHLVISSATDRLPRGDVDASPLAAGSGTSPAACICSDSCGAICRRAPALHSELVYALAFARWEETAAAV